MRHWCSKLTDEHKADIVARVQTGATWESVATAFGVNRTTIARVLRAARARR